MAKRSETKTILETLIQTKRDLANVTTRERKLESDLGRTRQERRAAEKSYTSARKAVIEEFGEI